MQSLVEISLVVQEKKVLKFCQSIFAISLIISPRKKVGPFIWTNLKPLHKGALCKVWLKFSQWFWRRRFLISSKYYMLFHIYLPLEKGGTPHLKNLNPFTKGCFVPNLVEIGPVVLEKKSKIGKVYRHTDGQTDDGRQTMRQAHLSFQLRWAKNLSHTPPWPEQILHCKLERILWF